MSTLQRFFATFGTGMEYYRCYVELHAEDHHRARAFMIGAHGERWAELYTEAEFGDQAERYNLHRLVAMRQISGSGQFEIAPPSLEDQIGDDPFQSPGIRTVLRELKAADGIVTADVLSSQAGVSHRTVYRYVQALRRIGFRILSQAGAGYMLMPTHRS